MRHASEHSKSIYVGSWRSHNNIKNTHHAIWSAAVYYCGSGLTLGTDSIHSEPQKASQSGTGASSSPDTDSSSGKLRRSEAKICNTTTDSASKGHGGSHGSIDA